jgi:hypothetical protein
MERRGLSPHEYPFSSSFFSAIPMGRQTTDGPKGENVAIRGFSNSPFSNREWARDLVHLALPVSGQSGPHLADDWITTNGKEEKAIIYGFSNSPFSNAPDGEWNGSTASSTSHFLSRGLRPAPRPFHVKVLLTLGE